MVPDNLTELVAYVGVPFRHGFATSKVLTAAREEGEPPRLDMRMEIVHPDGQITTLTYGHGLMEGFRLFDSTATVAFSMWDPGLVGLGDHHFTVMAYDTDGANVLAHTGVLRISDDVPAQTDRPPAPVWDMVTPKDAQVADEIRDARLAICAGCPAYGVDHICSECGCYMPVKAALAIATCPLNRWLIETGTQPN